MVLNDAQQLFGLFFAIYFFIIIDRSHEMYRPWDTYRAAQGKRHAMSRLLLAWLLLIVLPIAQFAVLFTLLGYFEVTFNATPTGVLLVILISISSFFAFGYYRIYEAFIHRYPEKFFSRDEREDFFKEIRPDFWAHFTPGALYLLIPTLLLLITFYI